MHSPNDQVVIPRRVVTREVDGASVLLDTETGRYFTLDAVGTRIWALLSTTTSIEGAYDSLLNEFDVDPQTLRNDLDTLVEVLVAEQLLEIRHG